MMRGLLLAGLLVTLGGCAVPQGPERLAADVANCRRHAEQGPGGPSRMVSNGLGLMPASRRRATIAVTAVLTQRDRDVDRELAAFSSKEAVYWDCMRVRGYSISMPGRPLVPERIGALPHIRL